MLFIWTIPSYSADWLSVFIQCHICWLYLNKKFLAPVVCHCRSNTIGPAGVKSAVCIIRRVVRQNRKLLSCWWQSTAGFLYPTSNLWCWWPEGSCFGSHAIKSSLVWTWNRWNSQACSRSSLRWHSLETTIEALYEQSEMQTVPAWNSGFSLKKACPISGFSLKSLERKTWLFFCWFCDSNVVVLLP